MMRQPREDRGGRRRSMARGGGGEQQQRSQQRDAGEQRSQQRDGSDALSLLMTRSRAPRGIRNFFVKVGAYCP